MKYLQNNNTDCWFALLVLLFFSGDIKKKTLKNEKKALIMTIFLSTFFRPHDPKSKKNPVNQQIKKTWPN